MASMMGRICARLLKKVFGGSRHATDDAGDRIVRFSETTTLCFGMTLRNTLFTEGMEAMSEHEARRHSFLYAEMLRHV